MLNYFNMILDEDQALVLTFIVRSANHERTISKSQVRQCLKRENRESGGESVALARKSLSGWPDGPARPEVHSDGDSVTQITAKNTFK